MLLFEGSSSRAFRLQPKGVGLKTVIHALEQRGIEIDGRVVAS